MEWSAPARFQRHHRAANARNRGLRVRDRIVNVLVGDVWRMILLEFTTAFDRMKRGFRRPKQVSDIWLGGSIPGRKRVYGK